MSRLTTFLDRRRLKARGYHVGHAESLWRQLIVRHVPGRTFADVGCMWRVNGDYAFLAAARGATAVTGIDVNPATAEFTARNASLGEPVRFVQADLNDPAIHEVGCFDVVFCSGVLYHVPDPVFSLTQLRRLCRETLILTTASMPDGDVPNVAALLVGLDAAERARLAYPTRHEKRGLDSGFDPARGYANWIWLPTPGCVRAMLTLAGFAVQEVHPAKYVTTAVARPDAAVPWGPTRAGPGAPG